MRWSIRYQLLVPLVTLLLGVVGISTWTALASAGRARQQIEDQLRDVAGAVSGDPLRFPFTPQVLQVMKRLSGAEFLFVAHDGRRTTTLPDDATAVPETEAVVDDWRTLRLGPRVEVAGNAYLGCGLRLRWPHPAEGGTLYILYPEALWRDALWAAVRPSLVLGIFGGLASVLLAVGVAQRLGRRIQELERRTRLIAAGDFSPMPLPGRDDELRDLGRSVNEMAERLAQLQETVKQTERLRLLGQVGGGLAHQLRNGVTGARLAVQLHAQECAGRTDAETLDVALRQLTLVEANLKRFLDLGRTDSLHRVPCSLPALIEEAVTLLRPQCRHAHIDLRWQAPAGNGSVTIMGDPAQLGHLLLNVIGNAIEAAGPGGWVEVQLRTEGSQSAIIEVADSGPGPSPEVAGRLFEPFVTSKREGVGLGLAVARQAAEAHGGRINWSRQADRTRFCIELPLNPDRAPLHRSNCEPRSDRR
jgi:signal transduction histidine kinase